MLDGCGCRAGGVGMGVGLCCFFFFSFSGLPCRAGYYRGVGGIPLQMAAEQYLAIMVALITVPHRTVKEGLERDGAAFVDESKNLRTLP